MEVYPTMITSASEKPGNMKRIQWQSSVLLPHYFLCEFHTHAYGMLHMLTFFFIFGWTMPFNLLVSTFETNSTDLLQTSLWVQLYNQASGSERWAPGPSLYCPSSAWGQSYWKTGLQSWQNMFNNNDKTHVYMKSLFATDKRDNSVFLHFQKSYIGYIFF